VDTRVAALAIGLASFWITFSGIAFAASNCPSGLDSADTRTTAAVAGKDAGAQDAFPSRTHVAAARGDFRERFRERFERSRVVAWVRAAVEKLGFPRATEARGTDIIGPPIELDASCRNVVTASNPSVVVPLPRERPTRKRPDTPLAARFGSAFLAADQTPGARSIARELAVRTSAVVSSFAPIE
jgi:hypothetical protein